MTPFPILAPVPEAGGTITRALRGLETWYGVPNDGRTVYGCLSPAVPAPGQRTDVQASVYVVNTGELLLLALTGLGWSGTLRVEAHSEEVGGVMSHLRDLATSSAPVPPECYRLSVAVAYDRRKQVRICIEPSWKRAAAMARGRE